MSRLNSQASAEDQNHRELLAKTAEGSREAFNELYTLVYGPLVRFIYRYTQSTVIIEEILNDTLLIVWQKAGTFRGESRAMTWVLGIASRRALKTISREQSWYTARTTPDHSPPSANDLSRFATQEALEWAMEQLSLEQRLAIELAYYHGLSCEEIAQVFDCPLSTAKTRLHYGRNKLRAIFDNQFETLDFSDLVGGASQ